MRRIVRSSIRVRSIQFILRATELRRIINEAFGKLLLFLLYCENVFFFFVIPRNVVFRRGHAIHSTRGSRRIFESSGG